jgi:hypothetical protein
MHVVGFSGHTWSDFLNTPVFQNAFKPNLEKYRGNMRRRIAHSVNRFKKNILPLSLYAKSNLVMPEKNIKRLPYGTSNFERLILENYCYVDKTRFIALLENEANPYQFFIRPRKFGKSLFFSILDNYYDLNKAKIFEALFGDLYIGKDPTPKHNSYLSV